MNFFPNILYWKIQCLKKKNITKDISNVFRLRKELYYTAIKYIRNLFRLAKEPKVIKDRLLRDVRDRFEH